MDYRSPDTELLVVVPAESARRGRPVLAWIVILSLAAVVVAVQYRQAAGRGKVKVKGEGVSTRILEIQCKYFVAATNLVGKKDPQLGQQLDALPAESDAERIRLATVVGEVLGPEKALERLEKLEEQHAPVPAQGLVLGGAGQAAVAAVQADAGPVALAEVLRRLYGDLERKEFDFPSVTEAERQRLRDELGWFGELVLAPAEGPDTAARERVLQAANQVLFGVLAVFGVLGLVGIVGLIGLVMYFIFLFGGRIRPLVRESSGHGGVYAETFAVWMVLFLGLGLLLGLLPIPRLGLFLQGLAMAASTAALFWPVLRGIPWQQVRLDIGLTAGRRPWLEPFVGVGAWVMAIPLLAVSMILIVLLFQLFGPSVLPANHPAAEEAINAGWGGRVQLLVLACIAAPLIEEIFFRGVLYRHLREATHRWGHVLSFLCSALAVSFLFAVIHPQGVFGVPMLMALAFAFTLVREWRGSLVAPMAAHALNNGIMMLIVVFGLGN